MDSVPAVPPGEPPGSSAAPAAVHIDFDDNALSKSLYGEYNEHLRIVEKRLGVTLAARGTRVAYSGGRSLPKSLAHALRRRNGVPEEDLQTRAEVVQSGLAVRRAQDTVLRALTPAIGQVFALPAVRGQRLGLGVPEADLHPRRGRCRILTTRPGGSTLTVCCRM